MEKQGKPIFAIWNPPAELLQALTNGDICEPNKMAKVTTCHKVDQEHCIHTIHI